jgi:LPS export ABC transporter protein LptC
MNTRTALLLFAFGVFIALALLLRSPDEEMADLEIDEGFRQSYYLENFHLTHFDDQGVLHHTVQGKRLEQNAANGESLLHQPQAIFFRNNQATWEVTADNGWMDANRKNARLQQNVTINRLDNSQTKATTSIVHLELPQQIARNDVPVDIMQGANTLSGVGIEMFLAENRLKLLSDIRGRYVP